MNISTNKSEQNNAADEVEKVSITKKPYHTPKVEKHGTLSTITQLNPNRGGDGNSSWADCSLS